MKRILLDTNIYRWIIERQERELIENLMTNRRDISIYGNPIIRKELRQTPKGIRILNAEKLRNMRIYLLTLYDELVKKEIEITDKMKSIANHYLEVYKELGGSISGKELLNDFIIVASASSKDLDIVVSQDNRTMLHPYSIKSYRIVNKIENLENPNFISYEEFKDLLRGYSDKFFQGSPKFGVFHILSITFPNIFFVRNKHPNINSYYNIFKLSFSHLKFKRLFFL